MDTRLVLIVNPGDRVSIEDGPFAGRSGVVKRNCSKAFADFCMVTLDKTPRERTIKTAMIACVNVSILPSLTLEGSSR